MKADIRGDAERVTSRSTNAPVSPGIAMRMRSITVFSSIVAFALTTNVATATAQNQAGDPSARLAAVLPADAARHVLAVMGDARSENLPSDALANRSLKFAARGIAPQDIAHAADEQLVRMRTARDVLRTARSVQPSGDEIEAGAEALREGVKGLDVAKLAQSAPSGRSLAVPLYVIGSMVSRGLPSDQALQRVQVKLAARASDADIEGSGRDNVGSSESHANEGRSNSGRGNAAGAGQSGSQGEAGSGAHGPPSGVPGNAGNHERPNTTGHGNTPATGKGHP